MTENGKIFYRYAKDVFFLPAMTIVIHVGILEGISRKMPQFGGCDPLEKVIYYFLVCCIAASQAWLFKLPRIVLFNDSFHVIGPRRLFLLHILCSLAVICFACLSGFSMLAIQVNAYLVTIFVLYCICLSVLRIVFGFRRVFLIENIDSLRAEFAGIEGVIVYIDDNEIECEARFPIERFLKECQGRMSGVLISP